MAGATAAVAASTWAAPTRSPARSAPSRKAISGSTRGWMSWPVSSGSPTSSSMASVSSPYSGSATPIWACLARLVRPSLNPSGRSPAAASSRTPASWTA